MKRKEMLGMVGALPVALSAILAIVVSQPLGAQSVSLSPGAIFRDCADCPEMVVIPDGKFQMGSDRKEKMREGLRPEGPIRSVAITKPFAAGRFEVTNAQYAAFVEATGYSATNGCVTSGGRDPVDGVTWRNPGIGTGVADDEPVVCVDWHDAKAYTLWLAGHTGFKYRLLTEAEWEYAAKSGSTAVWPWDDDETQICQYGNVFDQSGLTDPRSKIGANAAATAVACDDGFQTVAPVGQFQPNAFGLYDTIGNVWEWNEDCSVTLYSDEPVDGSAWQAPGVCEKRAVRSGSWRTRISRHRPTFRGRDPADFAYFMFGFRLARDLN